MTSFTCPACGAEVPVRSAAMPYVVCGHCRSVLLRDGQALSDIGKSAMLPFDVSPIQLGTSGAIDGVRFDVVGRVRWGWEDGSWNEWLLTCTDGQARWLGEAMGQFMLLSERKDLVSDPLLVGFGQGQPIRVGDRVAEFIATDVKQVRCLGGEGDLPFPTPADWMMTSVDFRDSRGRSLSVQRDADGVSAYAGRYVRLEELRPHNLRRIEGWTLPAGLR
ncbi:DUF4178 domain-containing protein [Sphingomonas sp. BN140010]|uniref:DUF4178 domain-containing protein n=1 Tax=Sphingomonas arvum TaxID=2992113 RepID=A0ABT3JCS1_9SPHN|nr:DUF4178 domain-containing protein [Sphingomonas sp. BN140010]MCW3796873.1 DUF4178 domain-containing protein [Sphingomonas sp. BN140010]